MRVSIITPTYLRHNELPEYFVSLENQIHSPLEIILVDGSPLGESRSENYVSEYAKITNLNIRYYREAGGTAIQRNYGIQRACGDIILFVDDDVRLEPDFISNIVNVFENDKDRLVGGVTGLRYNRVFDLKKSRRWKAYRFFNLLKNFEPGKYDFHTGIPVNANGQGLFNGVREVDFMTTACTAYRREILDNYRFDKYFIGYGMLEDAHLSLRVKFHGGFKLYQSGDARCIELNAESGRTNSNIIAFRTVSNYFYVFESVFGPLNSYQKFRFVQFQLFEWMRSFVGMIIHPGNDSLQYFSGKSKGIIYLLKKVI